MKKIIASACLFTSLNICCMCEEIVSALHDVTFGEFLAKPKELSNKAIAIEIAKLEKKEGVADSYRYREIAKRYDILLQRARVNKTKEKVAEYQKKYDENSNLAEKASLCETINALDQDKTIDKVRKYAHLEHLYGMLLPYTLHDEEETTEVKDGLSDATRKRIRAELYIKIETLEIEKNISELLSVYQDLLTTYKEAHPKRKGIQLIIDRLQKEKAIQEQEKQVSKTRENQILQLTADISAVRVSFAPTFENFDKLISLHKRRLTLFESDTNRYQREYNSDIDTTISLLGRQATMANNLTLRNTLAQQAAELRLLRSNTQSK